MNHSMTEPEIEELVRHVREGTLQEVEALLREAIRQIQKNASSWEQIEKLVRDGSHRLGAGILEAALRAMGNGYEHSVLACGCGGSLQYVSDRERRVVTLLGDVRLRRAYYRCPRCRATRIPLDERLRIAATDFSPGVQQAVARLGAHRPFAHGRELLGELTGLWISQRSHRLISERLGRAAPSQQTPLVAVSQPVENLYLLADGTMAPTRQGWREVKVGVAFTGRAGPDGKPRRQDTGYFADLLHAEEFGRRWYALAERLGRDHAKRLVVLGDGAAWIWNLADLHFPGAVQIVDWYHALERLWGVAHLVWGEEDPAAKRWMKPVRKHLRNGHIERLLTRLKELPARSQDAKAAAREAAGYFLRNAERMRYRRFRRQGLFIGSGVVEAGCKHIVGQRLKGSGMRWSLDGLRSILSLRLAVLYGPWPLPSKLAA
jgi:hypothetical protein